MKLVLVMLASMLAALGKLLASAVTWLGRSLATAIGKLVTEPIGFAVRVKDLLFAGLLIALMFAEAWDIGRRFILPLIHPNFLAR